MEFEDIDFESGDGTPLHGWYFKNTLTPKGPKGLILFFHGNAQNITAHYPNFVWALEHGYDYFIFDYRGYGLSEGSANQQGLHKDALAALDLAHQWRAEKEMPQLIVYSQSLGGIVAAKALEDDPKRDEISLVVFDSTFSSYQQVAYKKMQQAGWLRFLSPLGKVLMSDEYAPTDIYEKLETPVLVIHSKDDQIIDYENGEQIFERLQTNKKWFWSLENAPHISVFFVQEGLYRQKFKDLLDSLPQEKDKQ